MRKWTAAGRPLPEGGPGGYSGPGIGEERVEDGRDRIDGAAVERAIEAVAVHAMALARETARSERLADAARPFANCVREDGVGVSIDASPLRAEDWQGLRAALREDDPVPAPPGRGWDDFEEGAGPERYPRRLVWLWSEDMVVPRLATLNGVGAWVWHGDPMTEVGGEGGMPSHYHEVDAPRPPASEDGTGGVLPPAALRIAAAAVMRARVGGQRMRFSEGYAEAMAAEMLEALDAAGFGMAPSRDAG